MSTWWYVSDGERKGPVSDDDLHRLLISGTITSSSLVWKTGMAGWQPSAQVEELAPMLASLPPELPPELPPDQKRTEEASTSLRATEELLPGMTAEVNAFLETHFTRAREEALTVLRNVLEKTKNVQGRTAPLAQAQWAFNGLLEHAHQKLRPQMLSKARAAMRSRLASTQDTELIVAMHVLIDNCVDRFTCDLILQGTGTVIPYDQALREADRYWRLEHPQRANELPMFTEQIAALFSRDALAILASVLFAADENASPNVLNKEQYQAGKRLYDTWWNNLREKKITLEQWGKNISEPMARLSGQLLRHEVAATFNLLSN